MYTLIVLERRYQLITLLFWLDSIWFNGLFPMLLWKNKDLFRFQEKTNHVIIRTNGIATLSVKSAMVPENWKIFNYSKSFGMKWNSILTFITSTDIVSLQEFYMQRQSAFLLKTGGWNDLLINFAKLFNWTFCTTNWKLQQHGFSGVFVR